MRRSFFALLFGLIGSLSAQTTYFPPSGPGEWATTSWEDAGFRPEVVPGLDSVLNANGSFAFILLKGGKIVYENYYNGSGANRLHVWNSAGKSMMATLVGVAVGEELIKLDGNVTDYLGRGWTSADPAREDAIEIRHLLEMTSGLNEFTNGPDCRDPECLVYLTEPGTRWAYHSGAYIQVAGAIEATAEMTINQYLEDRLNTPTGMDGRYLPFGDNLVHVSRPRSMARFGLLVANNGVWDGNDLVGVPGYVADMLSPRQELNPAYGYLWWLNEADEHMTARLRATFAGPVSPAAPRDAKIAAGKSGQLINVVPSEDLVWIRLGETFASGEQVAFDVNEAIWSELNANRLATSVDRVESGGDLRLFPNPARDLVWISGEQGIEEITVVDGRGRTVMSNNYSGGRLRVRLGTEYWQSGLYVAVVRYADGSRASGRFLLSTHQ